MKTSHLELHYLLQQLSAILKDQKPQTPPSGLDWEKFYSLSYRHSVANMVWYGLNKLEVDEQPPKEIFNQFYRDYIMGVAKEATQHLEVEKLLQVFEQNGISCMPLKGYILKYLYPKPDMRSMTDVDILMKSKKAKDIKKLMSEAGFQLDQITTYHDVYIKKPFLSIELHRELIGKNSIYFNYFTKEWERASLKGSNKTIYELSIEDFYIYMIVHLTKHFASSGTGIRSIMDVWVYMQHYENKMDWEYVNKEFEKLKLNKFAGHIQELSKIWFDSAPSNELYVEMTEYIGFSGLYGTKKNHIISRVNSKVSGKRSMKSYKLIYILSLIFPDRERMITKYPILIKLPILYPFCWILRGAEYAFLRRRDVDSKISQLNAVTRKDIDKGCKFFKKVGL